MCIENGFIHLLEYKGIVPECYVFTKQDFKDKKWLALLPWDVNTHKMGIGNTEGMNLPNMFCMLWAG